MTKIAVLEAKDSPEWKECGTCYRYYNSKFNFKLNTKSYNFETDSFQIAVCPCPKPGFNFLFGPPFVPIVPNPFIFLPVNPGVNFFVDFKIDNKGNACKLDFSKFHFQVSEDSFLQVSSVKMIVGEHFGKPDEFFHTYRNLKDSIICANAITIYNPLIIRFEFPIPTTKVKRLTIKIDSLAEIKFRKHIRFIYHPFVFAS